MKIKDDRSEFYSISESEEMWNEVQSSDRSAILVVSAAFDTHLERILTKHFIKDGSKAKQLLESSLNSFGARISICYCLGLINIDEQNDLNLIKGIRNSFAHNLLNCHFANEEVKTAISNLTLIRKAGGKISDFGLKKFFLVGVMLLDKALLIRLNETITIKKCREIKSEEKIPNKRLQADAAKLRH